MKERMQGLRQVAVNKRHLDTLENLKNKMNVPYYAQVMRWAIDELAKNPNIEDTATGPFVYRMPTTTVLPDQVALVNRLATEKGVSRSQIVRNAIKALEIKLG